MAARMGQGKVKDAFRVFKSAFVFALCTGGAGALILYFGADFLTGTVMRTPLAAIALKVLAPTIFIVAILGVFRGFFQGLNTMVPSALSQIAEQIINAIVSIVAAYMLVSYGREIGEAYADPDNYSAAYGAAGGTLGTSLGALTALIFVIFIFFAYRRRFHKKLARDYHHYEESYSSVTRDLILTIMPILLSTIVHSLSNVIDQSVFKNIAVAQGYSSRQISEWWGVYSGQFVVLTNVPVAIATSLSSSSVPSLSKTYATGDKKSVNHQISLAMRFIMIIAIPSAVGMTVLGRGINQLLFADATDTTMYIMLLGSYAIVFYCMSTLSNGILQGINHMKTPIINALIALGAHVVVLFLLMNVFDLNIYAVTISNGIYAIIVSILNQICIKKYTGTSLDFQKNFGIPLLSSLIMGVVVYLVYQGCMLLFSSNAVGVIVSIIFGVIVYFVCLLLFKGITEDELLRFPKGSLLVSVGKKLHLL